MKIILRETYEGLGRPGDVVEVKGGYARNFLVPKGIAYPDNRFYRRLFDSEREVLLRKDAVARARAEETAGKAVGVELKFVVKIGDRGKMFGAITNSDIAKELADQGIEVDRRKIQLKEPIKTTGIYNVPVKLHGEVGFALKIEVEPEPTPPDELDDEELAALEAAEEAAAEAVEEAEEVPAVVEMVEVVEMEAVSSSDESDDSESAAAAATEGSEEDETK